MGYNLETSQRKVVPALLIGYNSEASHISKLDIPYKSPVPQWNSHDLFDSFFTDMGYK